MSFDLGAALERVGGMSPYFAVSTGPLGPGWGPVAELYRDDEVLAGLVGRIGARIGANETRVAASILFQGYAARLWSVTLGLVVRESVVPDLAGLLWRDVDGSVALHLERPTACSDVSVELARDQVVEAHLAPLAAAVGRLTSVSEHVLWGNAGSALLGTALVLDGAPSGPAHDLVAPLLTKAPLAGTMAGARRRSCCLFYRIPDGGYCADCVLTPRS